MLKIPNAADRMRKLAPQALAESLNRIPAISLTDEVAGALLAATGKTPSELQAAIDAKLRPASSLLGGVTIDLRLALASSTHGRSANAVGYSKAATRAQGRDHHLQRTS